MPDVPRTPHPHEVIEDRQHERRGLAGPRLRDAYEIPSLEEIRHRLLLDRRRLLVPRVLDRMLQLLVQLPENISFEHNA